MVNATIKMPKPGRRGRLLEKIDFGYPDPPTQHGWRISENQEDESQPVFRHFDDGFVGKAVEIHSTVRYAMDCDVKPIAELGSLVEFIAKMEGGAYVFARFTIQSRDGSSSRTVWLHFCVGKDQPYPLNRNSEWGFPLMPNRLDGEWLQFQVDLNKAVEQTYGQDGWRFGQLKGFRLRGNLSLAHISVFEAKR
jgi:hypothetical protein